MTKARYDLAVDIASFDFISWLVMAKAKGATCVVFDNIDKPKTTKWTADVVRQRFESILKPACALAGLPWEIGPDGVRMHMPWTREIITWTRAGNDFPRLKSVLPPGNERYTVTLRREGRLPGFNSNEPAWRMFAKDIGAKVIEDYDVEPISLHERFALYAGADMNFGIVNGPMQLILCSEHPVMMFNCNIVAHSYEKCGMKFGEQYPWARPHQRAIWESDTLDVLRRHFDEMQRAA